MILPHKKSNQLSKSKCVSTRQLSLGLFFHAGSKWIWFISLLERYVPCMRLCAAIPQQLSFVYISLDRAMYCIFCFCWCCLVLLLHVCMYVYCSTSNLHFFVPLRPAVSATRAVLLALVQSQYIHTYIYTIHGSPLWCTLVCICG